MNKEMIENEEILEEVEETTELVEVEEKEGFVKRTVNKVKEFGQSKAGKVLKTAGLIGAGFVAGLAVVKAGGSSDDSVVIDVTDDSVIIEDTEE